LVSTAVMVSKFSADSVHRLISFFNPVIPIWLGMQRRLHHSCFCVWYRV